MNDGSQASPTGHLPAQPSLPVLCTCLSPAGLKMCQRGGGPSPFVLFLTFNIHHAVLKRVSPDRWNTDGWYQLASYYSPGLGRDGGECGPEASFHGWRCCDTPEASPPGFQRLHPLWSIIAANGLATEASGA